MEQRERDNGAQPGDGLSSWALVKRLLMLAWRYRGGCVKVLSLQVCLLALGLAGLGLVGVGVDFIRYDMADAAAPAAGVSAAPEAPAASVSSHRAPHGRRASRVPRWPFGLVPPDSWPRLAVVGCVAGAILLFSFTRVFLNYAYTMAVTRLVQLQIVVDLRSRVYDKLQRMSFRFFDQNMTGSIINRVTGDTQSVRLFVDGVLMQSIILLLSLAIYIAYMARIHAGLTAACLVSTPLLWYATSRFSRAVQPAYRKDRELFDELLLNVNENLRGIHVVKGFSREPEQIAKFEDVSRRVRDQKHWIFRRVSTFQPLIGFLTQINLIVLLAYGGYLAIRYDAAGPDTAVRVGLSVGQLIVFAGLLQQFSGQVANIANVVNSMQQSLTGARRVFEILDAPMETESPVEAVAVKQLRGEVRFDHVSFAYKGGTPEVHDISLTVHAGQRVAILGATGSGKSTLLSLLPRFYDPTEGRILIDGVDIRRMDLDDLRRQIGLVFQESFLFSTSVASNIAFGYPEASREQIERAARIAAAHEFIMELPKGYDTILREGGISLSGGQRQRLAIARALLVEPAILLLDDPTAAIDSQTESEIMTAMEQAMAGRTTFIVAHRLATLSRADLIVVMEHGRIVQVGSHDELMTQDGAYRQSALLQLGRSSVEELLGNGRWT